MYTLSEQEGGVPKIFMEAQSTAKQNGRPTLPANLVQGTNEDDDDVVEVIIPSSDSLENRSCAKKQKAEEREIVEIL